MAEDSVESADASGRLDGAVVELRLQDSVINTTITELEDQLQVEVVTEFDDGTYNVFTYRFYLTRAGEAVPKHEVDAKFRLIVAAKLLDEGYDPSMSATNG